jgi:glycosyltransferase involved in cell wall biosynthesis
MMDYPNEKSPSLVIATILRQEGITGVHTHVRELRRYLAGSGQDASLVTPFSWRRGFSVPVFGARFAIRAVDRSAAVAWYRHWHEVFLFEALRQHLATLGDAVIYAQGPEAASASLRARQGPHQRVVLAVHYQYSQTNEWVEKRQLREGSPLYRSIRRMESDVIPRVDGIVYVSRSARDNLVSWLPAAAAVPSTIIPNYVKPIEVVAPGEPTGDLVTVGSLQRTKNHHFLIEVLAESKRAGHRLTLDIFGEGPLRKELHALARSLGVEEQVKLRGYDANVRKRLPGYRAYVHARPTETCSLAVIEAMAAGLPVVASNLGGTGELFDDGVEGRYWPLDDPAKAAAILQEVLTTEGTRSKLGTAARERFVRTYDARLVGPRLVSFLLTGEEPAEAADSTIPNAAPAPSGN